MLYLPESSKCVPMVSTVLACSGFPDPVYLHRGRHWPADVLHGACFRTVLRRWSRRGLQLDAPGARCGVVHAVRLLWYRRLLQRHTGLRAAVRVLLVLRPAALELLRPGLGRQELLRARLQSARALYPSGPRALQDVRARQLDLQGRRAGQVARHGGYGGEQHLQSCPRKLHQRHGARNAAVLLEKRGQPERRHRKPGRGAAQVARLFADRLDMHLLLHLQGYQVIRQGGAGVGHPAVLHTGRLPGTRRDAARRLDGPRVLLHPRLVQDTGVRGVAEGSATGVLFPEREPGRDLLPRQLQRLQEHALQRCVHHSPGRSAGELRGWHSGVLRAGKHGVRSRRGRLERRLGRLRVGLHHVSRGRDPDHVPASLGHRLLRHALLPRRGLRVWLGGGPPNTSEGCLSRPAGAPDGDGFLSLRLGLLTRHSHDHQRWHVHPEYAGHVHRRPVALVHRSVRVHFDVPDLRRQADVVGHRIYARQDPGNGSQDLLAVYLSHSPKHHPGDAAFHVQAAGVRKLRVPAVGRGRLRPARARTRYHRGRHRHPSPAQLRTGPDQGAAAAAGVGSPRPRDPSRVREVPRRPRLRCGRAASAAVVGPGHAQPAAATDPPGGSPTTAGCMAAVGRAGKGAGRCCFWPARSSVAGPARRLGGQALTADRSSLHLKKKKKKLRGEIQLGAFKWSSLISSSHGASKTVKYKHTFT
ncbi:uncharacterized protein [Dermacentor andersoni]|uniref:uncharacterized protein isoform X1 n=1 Tax=Dermacentor andersoni TaxID=34620 RepID=UPI003B3AA360